MAENFKPTLNKPVGVQSKNFEKNFNKIMHTNAPNIKLNEVDDLLTEKEQSLKKRIFYLPKMEALVFSDPKLTAVYDEMSKNGQEKYGYHYNETIMNIIFNDYVLNSPKYLEKYKMAIPKKKKRRDESGINKIRKELRKRKEASSEKTNKSNDNVDKEEFTNKTTSAGSSDTHATPAAWKKGNNDLMENENYQPQDDDCFIESNGNKYTVSCGGKFIAEFSEMDDALNTVKIWKQSNKYFPNTWYVSDHGNLSLIDDEGNVMNETTTAGSAGGAAGYVGYAGPAAWGSGDLLKKGKTNSVLRKPFFHGGKVIQESNYLINPSGFEKYVNMLEEADLSYQLDLAKQYHQSHLGSNNGLGVSEIPQSDERENLKKSIDDNTALYIGQDVDRMPDNNVKILYNDMTKKNTMFPHPENPNLQNDGVSGTLPNAETEIFVDDRDVINNYIVDKTNAFSSDMVKRWNDSDRSIELNTINKGTLDTPNLNTMEETANSQNIDEKAKSRKQQQFMGMVHAIQKGELDPKEVSPEMRKVAKEMKPKDVEDFAKTKHKGLPEKIKEKSKIKEDMKNTIKENVENKDFMEIKSKIGELPKGVDFREVNDQMYLLFDGNNSDAKTWALNISKKYGIPAYDTQNIGRKVNENNEDVIEFTVPEWAMPALIDGDMSGLSRDEIIKINVFTDVVASKYGNADFFAGKDNGWKSMKKYDTSNQGDKLYKIYVKPTKQAVYEDALSMIDNNNTSMANKPNPIGNMSNNVDMGTKVTGKLSEEFENNGDLLKELNDELEAFSVYHEKLVKIVEDRKPSALVLKDRLGKENEKNFKSDLGKSDTKQAIDIEKELQWKEQQKDIGENPQILAQNLEKKEIKATDAKGEEALKNVGDSDNDEGDEIPKRNLRDEEQHEVDMYRLGQHSLIYDNEPSKRFEDRMKADMGDKLYKTRQEQLKFRSKAPMYNKDSQPVKDSSVNKVEFNKEKSGWNEREGLKESLVTGKYLDSLNKSNLIDFDLNEAKILESSNSINEMNLYKIDFKGLGNIYYGRSINSSVVINESVINAFKTYDFYTDGKNVFAVKKSVKNLNENKDFKDNKEQINEELNKMKHLLNYSPKEFIDTTKIKKNGKF